MALDLTTANAAQQLFDQLVTDGIRVDILINNAGYGSWGAFAEIPDRGKPWTDSAQRDGTHLSQQAVSGPMLERRSGKIMNVASTAGFQPGPLMAVYYATKAYVISFSEALANELSEGRHCHLPLPRGYRDRLCQPCRQR